MSDLIYNAIRTTDGTILESRSVHDFVGHTDANGKFYAVDGGLEYPRRCGDMDYEELSLTDKDPFSKVRGAVTWGTRGKDGNQPLEYKKVKDLDTAHIRAILETQRISHQMKYVLETESFAEVKKRAMINI